MKYLIIGAGGVGGTLAVYMYKAGLDVSLALTPKRKQAVEQQGLKYTFSDGTTETCHVKAVETSNIGSEVYDVIFICVKSGQLQAVLDELKQLPYTPVLIPMMNGIGNAERIRGEIDNMPVGDACIYLGAYKKEYNWVQQDNNGVKIILDKNGALSAEIEADLAKSGMIVKLSDRIEYDKFLKFFFVSPLAASQAVFACSSDKIFACEEKKEYFRSLSQELYACAKAAGMPIPEDAVDKNVVRLGKMPEDSYASMARDYLDGKAFEKNVMVDEALMLGKRYGCDMKLYANTAAAIEKGSEK